MTAKSAKYVAAFDAAGHEADQPCLSVAGFISTAEIWPEFSAEWKKRLGDLPFYHHTEHRNRRDLVRELVELIPQYAFRKFGCAITIRTFDTIPNLPKKLSPNWRLNAYSLCAQQCVGMVRWWAYESGIAPEGIDYVFEEGDIGKGLLINILKASKHPRPAFEYKKDTPMNGEIRRGFAPLQAADLLANELFQQVRLSDLTRPVLPYRALENMPGHLSVVTQDMVDEYVAFLRAPEFASALRVGW